MLPKLDNHDLRIRYVPLRMERALDTVPEISLPQGYAFRFYREGDREAWIDIERARRNLPHMRKGWSLGRAITARTKRSFPTECCL